jgi:hypothetical protein
MKLFDIGITIIIIVKVIFIILLITQFYFKYKQPNNTKLLNNLKLWRTQIEFIFIFFMSLLLIYLFNPRINRVYIIDFESRLLLFLFGIILIISADWEKFFTNVKSNLLINITKFLRNLGPKQIE